MEHAGAVFGACSAVAGVVVVAIFAGRGCGTVPPDVGEGAVIAGDEGGEDGEEVEDGVYG